MSVKRKQVASGKAVTFTPVSGVQWQFGLPGSNFNYAAAVGDGLRSSVVVPLLCWLMRSVPEPPIVVEQLQHNEWIVDPKHGLRSEERRVGKECRSRVWED